MKKWILIFAVLIGCFSQIHTLAANGSIKIEVPEEAGKITVSYVKIADWENAEQKEFEEIPNEDVEYENTLEFETGETILLMDLEEGIYQIQIQGNEEFEFSPVIVSVPLWNEEEKQMEYEIQAEPKYIRSIPEPEPEPETPKTDKPEEASPKTGDYETAGIYGIFGMFSLLIVIMSCHNRFKCARMSE